MAIYAGEKEHFAPRNKALYGFEIKEVKEEDITLEMLEDGLRSSARLVKQYGRVYLPIFERLDSEVREWKRRDKLFEKALRLADLDSDGSV